MKKNQTKKDLLRFILLKKNSSNSTFNSSFQGQIKWNDRALLDQNKTLAFSEN